MKQLFKNLNKTYDQELMDSENAKFIIDYLEENLPVLANKLKAENVFYSFAETYVKLFIENAKTNRDSGMAIYESRMESLKDTIYVLENDVLEHNKTIAKVA